MRDGHFAWSTGTRSSPTWTSAGGRGSRSGTGVGAGTRRPPRPPPGPGAGRPVRLSDRPGCAGRGAPRGGVIVEAAIPDDLLQGSQGLPVQRPELGRPRRFLRVAEGGPRARPVLLGRARAIASCAHPAARPYRRSGGACQISPIRRLSRRCHGLSGPRFKAHTFRAIRVGGSCPPGPGAWGETAADLLDRFSGSRPERAYRGGLRRLPDVPHGQVDHLTAGLGRPVRDVVALVEADDRPGADRQQVFRPTAPRGSSAARYQAISGGVRAAQDHPDPVTVRCSRWNRSSVVPSFRCRTGQPSGRAVFSGSSSSLVAGRETHGSRPAAFPVR
ncbi:hypothetical protein SCALM49S_05017 [Streptomyces californicus]